LRILAYDLRGHGVSELPAVPEGREGWSDFADDLVALLETLDLREVVLAGHSMGGTVSLLAAAKAKARVRALALFEPVIDAPGPIRDPAALERVVSGALRRRNSFPSKEAAAESFVGKGAFAPWPREFIADFCEGGLRPLGDGTYALACSPQWEASNYETHPHDVWDAVWRAPRPVRMLRGEIWSSAGVESQLDRLTANGVHVRTFSGVGHFLPMERPDLVTETLMALQAFEAT